MFTDSLMPEVQANRKEAPKKERALRKHIENLMDHLIKLNIGGGESGIVIQFEDPKFNQWCAKYQKFSYNPKEFNKLKTLFAAGKSVPMPWFEVPERQLFVMERLKGKTIETLVKGGMKFSPEVIEEIEETVRDFNDQFSHNDLRRENIFLEDLVVKDGVVVSGTPFLIDVERATRNKPGTKSDEYMLVRGLFIGKTAKPIDKIVGNA